MHPPRVPEGVTLFTVLPEPGGSQNPVIHIEYVDRATETVYGAKFAIARREVIALTKMRLVEYGVFVITDRLSMELGPAYEDIKVFRDDVLRWAEA